MVVKFTANPILVNLTSVTLDPEWIDVRDEDNNKLDILSFERPNSINLDPVHFNKTLTIRVIPTTLFEDGDYNEDVKKLIDIYRFNIGKDRGFNFLSSQSKPRPRAVTRVIPSHIVIDSHYYIGEVREYEKIKNITQYLRGGKTIVRPQGFDHLWIVTEREDDIFLQTNIHPLGPADNFGIVPSMLEPYDDSMFIEGGRAFYFDVSGDNHRFLPVRHG